MQVAELHYKVRWRARGSHPGHHASQQRGAGFAFSHHVPLAYAPDPRRFDVHASLRDPFGQVQVRVYRQTSAIPVFAIADLSASMGFGGAHAKLARVAEFVACLGYSASRTGDSFGFVGCADDGTRPLYAPPSANPAAAFEIAAVLRKSAATGRTATGLLAAADLLGPRRALVFLLSDFHFPSGLLTRVLASLAYHDVVPVMLWDRREYDTLPDWGLVRVRDPETARERLLVLRPALRRRIREAFEARRTALTRLFMQHGRVPLVLQDEFKPDDVTRYFLG